MKRVLVLNQFALPRSEAGGTRHAELFSRLREWRPLILAGDRNHASQQRYSTIDPLFLSVRTAPSDGSPRRRATSWLTYCVGALSRALRLGHIDLVYASTPHLFTPLVGGLIAKAHGACLVVEVRDLWPRSIASAGILQESSLLYRLLEVLERWIYRSADHLVVVTNGWEGHLREKGVQSDRVSVIPNGAEPADFLVSESKNDLRREYNLTKFTVIFSGSHGPKDGIDLIIDAAEVNPGIDFLLVGTGPMKNVAIERVNAARLCNVRFMNLIPKQELPRLLSACDLGIHAVAPLKVFDLGMSPNKLFDYLAAGLPIVSNAATALSGVVGQAECGILGGIDSLPENIAKAASAPQWQRDEWSRQGLGLMRQTYSRTASSAALEKTLNTAVELHCAKKGRRRD